MRTHIEDTTMKTKNQSGIALATTLIVLFLVVALVVGFSWMVMVDQRLGGVNGDSQLAFYGAEAGMEKLTADLGNLFNLNSAPSGAQVKALATAADTPAVPGVNYVNPDGTLGYEINFPTDASGNPLATNHTILSGAYQGMTGLLTPYTLQVTARTVNGGSEVRLTRDVQTVAIPAFGFGMFSQTDLSFFAGPNFNFGGRVHTNGNLFLASGADLYFFDKVTAAGEVVRQTLSNNWPTSSGYTGNVFVPTTAGGCNTKPTSSTASCRELASTEGSVTGSIGAWTPNEPTWSNLSLGTYNGFIRNGKTGAKSLNLSITLNGGAQPIDLVRRALPNEDTTNPSVLAQRYYSEASVRILLSDNPLDISGLPCESSNPPMNLATLTAAQTGGVPIASSGGGASYSSANGYWTPLGTPLVSGYIKIEVQTAYAVAPAPCGTWKDVTAEVLGLGIAGKNLRPSISYGTYGSSFLPSLPTSAVGPSPCGYASPNAIIRLERIRDNPSTGTANDCGTGSIVPTDYWPNALFDTREGNLRDNCPNGSSPCNFTQPTLNGVMNYTELDVNNLAKWLTGAIGASGTLAKDPNISSNDFVVYFSDRRGNYTPSPVAGWPAPSPSGNETGEYGFEDSINPANSNGCPDGTLDQGETFDMVENAANQAIGMPPEDYGEAISSNTFYPYGAALLGFAGVNGTAIVANSKCSGPGGIWPFSQVARAQEARENTNPFFRRALKIVNGSSINLGTCPDGVACGLTIVSENPVYVQGDYNAPAGSAGSPTAAHIATSIVADAITLLSDNWNDVNSFAFPYRPGGGSCPSGTSSPCGRYATTTTYRFAGVSGKGISFGYPGYGSYQDFGTDGGVHNFYRFLEDWGGQSLYYRGSIVSFYYNRQATGVYKCCNTVYSPPTRGYQFDADFLTPTLLPPRTPMFRDVNTIGFAQTILPTK
jgi:hypothetical protein